MYFLNGSSNKSNNRLYSKTTLFLIFWVIVIFLFIQIPRHVKYLDINVGQFRKPHWRNFTKSIQKFKSLFIAEEEPKIERNVKVQEKDLFKDIKYTINNLPEIYFNGMKTPKNFNSTCASFPTLYDLEFNNIYWQTLKSTNGTFELFGAYLDVREENLLGPSIRILGMIDRERPTLQTYCQIWYDGQDKPDLVKVHEYRLIWETRWWGFPKGGTYEPYLITCVLPKKQNDSLASEQKIPSSVSLVEKPCDSAINNVKVIYNKVEENHERKDFAVCVKDTDIFQDVSVRLTEWLELLFLLGADIVHFYICHVHPNVTKVLNFYEEKGRVTQTPINVIGQPDLTSYQHLYKEHRANKKMLHELVPYNDCFYKNMYQYKYVILIDVDEVIMPVKYFDWKELMNATESKVSLANKKGKASFNARNVYFFDEFVDKFGFVEDIPRYMHILQHVYRSGNYTPPGHYIKCFHNTEKVQTLHNHFPFSCLQDCESYSFDTSEAHLQHYRADCVGELRNVCPGMKNNSVRDETVWKFKEPLIERVTDVLRTLGFLST